MGVWLVRFRGSVMQSLTFMTTFSGGDVEVGGASMLRILHENHMHEIALFIKTVVFEGYVLHTPSEEGGGKEQDAI